MPRLKKDRSVEEWLAHGRNALVNLPKHGKLYKTISTLLDDLKNHYPQDIDIIEETVANLNETKDDFPITIGRNGKPKSQWTLWVARFTQKKKDAQRSKFYVSDTCHKQVKLISENSSYTDPNKYLEQLSSILSGNGILDTSDLFDLHDLLEPFKDALRTSPSTDLRTEDKKIDFSLLAITKAVTDELSNLGIKDYRSLSSINKKIRDADKYDEMIRSQLNEMQQQLEIKSEIMTCNTSELFKLNKTIKRLEAENENLKYKLKICNNRKRQANKTVIKPIGIPPNS